MKSKFAVHKDKLYLPITITSPESIKAFLQNYSHKLEDDKPNNRMLLEITEESCETSPGISKVKVPSNKNCIITIPYNSYLLYNPTVPLLFCRKYLNIPPELIDSPQSKALAHILRIGLLNVDYPELVHHCAGLLSILIQKLEWLQEQQALRKQYNIKD